MRLVALCVLLAAASGAYPGARLVIDQFTANQVANLAAPIVEGMFPMHIGDFNFEKKVLWFTCGVEMNNITVDSLSFLPNSQPITFDDGSDIYMAVLAAGTVTFELKLQVGFVKHSTFVTANFQDAELDIAVVFNGGVSPPQIDALSTIFVNWLLNLAGRMLQDSLWWISDDLSTAAMNLANSYLATSPLRIPFSGFTLDLSNFQTDLQASPTTVNPNYLSIPLNATILTPNGAYPLTGPSETPVMNENGLPVQLFLTDYTLQSAFNALWPLLQADVTALPEAFVIITGFTLDTASFQILVPELYQKYGETAVLLSVASVPGIIPQVQLTMGLQTAVTLNFTLSVQSGGEWVPACSLQSTVDLGLTFQAEELNFYLQVTQFTMAELSQTAGIPIDVARTQSSFNELLTLYFADINGLFHNTVIITQERVTFVGLPWLQVNALELVQSAGYLQPGWQIILT